METTENSFTGTIFVNESSTDIDGVFNGMNDSGTYGFIWGNPTKGAILNVDLFGDSGSAGFVLEDSRSNEVLNGIISGESNMFLINGKKGKWKVRIVFFEFEGNGKFDLTPLN